MPLAKRSTSEFLAKRKFNHLIDREWVEWAVQMLLEGKNTPAIRELAGESEPFDQEDMGRLVDKAFAELNEKQFETLGEAATAFVKEVAIGMVNGSIPFLRGLNDLGQLQVEMDYPVDTKEFYTLNLAWRDFNVWGQSYTGYMEATAETIEPIVVEYLNEWVLRHQGEV